MYFNSTIANATLSTLTDLTNSSFSDRLDISAQAWHGFYDLIPQEWTRQLEVFLMMWMYAITKDIIMYKLRLGYRGYKRVQRYRESDLGEDFLSYNDPSKLTERANEMETILTNIENDITSNVKKELSAVQFKQFEKLNVTYTDELVFNQEQTTNNDETDESWSFRRIKPEVIIPETRSVTRTVNYRGILKYSGTIAVEDGRYKTRFRLEPLYQESAPVAFKDMDTIMDTLRDKVPVLDVENESQSIYEHLAAGASLL